MTKHQVELHIHAAQTVEEVLSNLPLRSVFPAIVHGHHQQNPGFQDVFANDLFPLVSSFEELENSLSEEGGELMATHSKEIIDSTVVNTVLNAIKIGEEQFNTFNKERLVE